MIDITKYLDAPTSGPKDGSPVGPSADVTDAHLATIGEYEALPDVIPPFNITPHTTIGAGLVGASAFPALGVGLEYRNTKSVDKSFPPFKDAAAGAKGPGLFDRIFNVQHDVNYTGVDPSAKGVINAQTGALTDELKALTPTRGVDPHTGAVYTQFDPARSANEAAARKLAVQEARARAGLHPNIAVGDTFAHAPMKDYKPPVHPKTKTPIDLATGNPVGKVPTSTTGKILSFAGRRVLPGAGAGLSAVDAADAFQKKKYLQGALHTIGAIGNATAATGALAIPGTIAGIAAPAAAYGLNLIGSPI